MYRQRVILLIALTIAIVALYYPVSQLTSLDSIIAHERWLREATLAQPVVVLAVAFVIYVLLTMIPGLAGKAILFGWLLGFLPGLLIVNIGLTVAALIMFQLSRLFLHETVESKAGWVVRRLHRGLEGSGTSYLLLLRLLHAPFTITNYALGATNVGPRQFWWTTQLGLVPGNVAFVLAGASLPSLQELKHEGLWSFVNIPLLVGLTLIGVLPIIVNWIARRSRHADCKSLGQQRKRRNHDDLLKTE